MEVELHVRTFFYLWVSVIAGAFGVTASAQSTGSIEFEESYEISADASEEGISGRVTPDETKAKEVVTQELIKRQSPGQTVLNTLNQVPAVNFTNSDPYGSSGGSIRIRGFDGSRISLTFDGVPLNDSGNYAIYSNQQLDPELIKSANVNLGTTDVDSPTASAAGGTVNYLSLLPNDKLSGELNSSYGEFNFYRFFGLVHAGKFTNFGTKAWMSASIARNDKFKGPGEIFKQQYNGRIYQPIGDQNDFVSLSFHYNQNRNNFYANPNVGTMATFLNTGGATVIPLPANISPASPLDLGTLTAEQQVILTQIENFATCTRTSGRPGTAQNDNSGILPDGTPTVPGGSNNLLNTSSCTNYAGIRINPSNTGNIRLNSRFKLPANLTLTADAAFQYVLANGGGFTALAENNVLVKGANTTGQGVDFNQDGDFLDTIGFYTPSNTNTHRYTVMTSLIWDAIVGHRLRLAYTFDLANHRQTGEYGNLDAKGNPDSVFGGRNGKPVRASDGFQLQTRDRLSIAMLNQISAQYVGFLFDDNLRAEVGLRMPFFSRDLSQNCYTQISNGRVTCSSQPATDFPTATFYAPFTAKYSFFSVLPNVGLRYKIIPELSAFVSYAQGFSAPRVDNLYRAPVAQVDPEKTNAVDGGLRFQMKRVTAQATGWYIGYQNRIVTSFDQVLGIAIDRNVGSVNTFGVDGSGAVKPFDFATLMLFGSYMRGEFADNIQIGGTANAPVFAPTQGKKLAETPEYMFGGRAEFDIGPLTIGTQGKLVGSRFATDVNDVIVPSYGIVDVDARINFAKFLRSWGFEDSWFQFNVTNVFNTFYFGSISTQTYYGTIAGAPAGANPSFSIGAPRAMMGTLHLAF